MNKPNKQGSSLKLSAGSAKARGAAMRALRRNHDDASRALNQYTDASQKPTQRTHKISDSSEKLKITFLGGLEQVGEKNMAIIEYQDDAIILDCGISLGVDLPGVHYEINDVTYLGIIKHKIKAYIITHGHLDHIGGLRHTVPKYPAPIYGSRYTIGVIEKTFENELVRGNGFKPDLVAVDIDNHQKHTIGDFSVEFIRVTHAIPDPAAVCIETPVGRIVATGDFRLDPEPLDNKPSDVSRLKEIGDKGVLLLLSDSSYADSEGRTPTEHTLQDSFHDVINNAPGRIFVAVFSSNMNRTQMIINAAVVAGRKVALDGRSMLAYAEIAVRQGILKVPKDTIVSMQRIASLPDNQILVMCTGGQGEPNAALQRMSEGKHKHANLEPGDTVVISSSPIPGNEISYDQLSNRLSKKGVRLFRHPTHQLDGCGPLHVSGHARRDELREMIRLIRPKFFIPVHAGSLRRGYHGDLAIEDGMDHANVLLPENGDSVYIGNNSIEMGGKVPHGSQLVDGNGDVVSNIVIKDRLLLSEGGILNVMLAIDRESGALLSSPDIISRGFIEMRESEELMKAFRSELRRAVKQRYGRVDLDRFKSEIREHIIHFIYEATGRTPIVIPVINLIDSENNERERFRKMRERLHEQKNLD